ncbi:MAG: hypothetical protein LBR58_00125 [Propionibacteriaceae bacterium]|jgi:hypothetical protein|nr:hypothetical protein [Propionibacteriaceae bacterium]
MSEQIDQNFENYLQTSFRQHLAGAVNEQQILPVYPETVKTRAKKSTGLKWAIGGAIVALAGATAAFAAPILFTPPTVEAVPAPAGTTEPEPTAVPPVEMLDTTGWQAYSDIDVPGDFQYPADWIVEGSCDEMGCVLFVEPPDSAALDDAGEGTTIELITGGQDDDAEYLGRVSECVNCEVVGRIPGLRGRTVSGETGDVIVVKNSVDIFVTLDGLDGYPDMISLHNLDSDELAPRSYFSFTTNTGNVGGDIAKDFDYVVTVLGTLQANADFAPQRYPLDADTGESAPDDLAEADLPKIGAVKPDSTWKTWKITELGISVQLPKGFSVVKDPFEEGDTLDIRIDSDKTTAGKENKEMLAWPDRRLDGEPGNIVGQFSGDHDLGAIPGLKVLSGAEVHIGFTYYGTYSEIGLFVADDSDLDFGAGAFGITTDDNWAPMTAADRDLVVAILASIRPL